MCVFIPLIYLIGIQIYDPNKTGHNFTMQILIHQDTVPSHIYIIILNEHFFYSGGSTGIVGV